jgi:hypothetical protein
MPKKKTYKPSGFNARNLTKAQLKLLLKHLTKAYASRGTGVKGWVTTAIARVKANIEDDTQNVSPRIANRLRRALELNTSVGEAWSLPEPFAPRGTDALVKVLDAC